MRFAFVSPDEAPEWYAASQAGLERALMADGHIPSTPMDPELALIFDLVDPAEPRPFLRRSRATFSVGITALDVPDGDLLKTAYPLLVRSISNSLVVLRGRDPHSTPWVITPELGCYPAMERPDEDPYEALFSRLLPMASSHLVIDNRFVDDLPQELWNGTPSTRELTWVSRVVDGWGLLPAPFPIQELLTPRQWKHLQRLYGIGGLSYGNFSIRHDRSRFWMSASGVDKGHLERIGSDILLVGGFDTRAKAMILHVPPDTPTHRVSVDAVEHHMVYQRFPEVGAMVHVHAWIPGVPTTRFNYPCGSVEAGEGLIEVLETVDNPGRAIVGMTNHGITATGPDFHDIIARIKDEVQPQVPMMAATP